LFEFPRPLPDEMGLAPTLGEMFRFPGDDESEAKPKLNSFGGCLEKTDLLGLVFILRLPTVPHVGAGFCFFPAALIVLTFAPKDTSFRALAET